MKEYGGVMLEDAEADAMSELERLVGAPFPKINDNEMEYYFQEEARFKHEKLGGFWYPPKPHYGFYPIDSHVVYLYLIGMGDKYHFKQLPVQCIHFKFLREFSFKSELVPEWLNFLPEIEKLKLCGIHDLQSLYHIKFQNMDRLTLLSLSNNNLTSIPQGVCQLSSIERLYLDSNNLKSIPEDICKLKSLQLLWLFGNQLETIPEGIADLPNLYSLNIRPNKITRLPEKIRLLYEKPNFEIHTDFDKLEKKKLELKWERMQKKPISLNITGPIKCDSCRCKFMSEKELNEHIRIEHYEEYQDCTDFDDGLTEDIVAEIEECQAKNKIKPDFNNNCPKCGMMIQPKSIRNIYILWKCSCNYEWKEPGHLIKRF